MVLAGLQVRHDEQDDCVWSMWSALIGLDLQEKEVRKKQWEQYKAEVGTCPVNGCRVAGEGKSGSLP